MICNYELLNLQSASIKLQSLWSASDELQSLWSGNSKLQSLLIESSVTLESTIWNYELQSLLSASSTLQSLQSKSDELHSLRSGNSQLQSLRTASANCRVYEMNFSLLIYEHSIMIGDTATCTQVGSAYATTSTAWCSCAGRRGVGAWLPRAYRT